ncbi:MAG: hypothetical protein ACTSRG_16005 [Candidatus Helarchaeota archaeon]
MELKKYKELFFLILIIWFVIIGGFWFIDLFIVPIDMSIPGAIGATINDFLKVSISTILVLLFLYLWDKLARIYYEYYRKKRIEGQID